LRLDIRLILLLIAFSGFLLILAGQPHYALLILGLGLILDSLLAPARRPLFATSLAFPTRLSYYLTALVLFLVFAGICWQTAAGLPPFANSHIVAAISLFLALLCVTIATPSQFWWLCAGVILTLVGLSGVGVLPTFPKLYSAFPLYADLWTVPIPVYGVSTPYNMALILGACIIVPVVIGYLQIDLGKIGTIILTGILVSAIGSSADARAFFVKLIPGMEILGPLGDVLGVMLGTAIIVIGGSAVGRLVATSR